MTSASSRVGVGIIGVSSTRGWAATAHIPALRALPNYEILALSARSAEAARAADERHEVIAAIERSAVSGKRVKVQATAPSRVSEPRRVG